MADRVLPSRDSFSDADIKTLYKHGFFDEEKIIMAYVSGRLVDRDTIDYEAVVDHLLAGAPDGILDEMSREEWLKYAKPLVDAALPDLEV